MSEQNHTPLPWGSRGVDGYIIAIAREGYMPHATVHSAKPNHTLSFEDLQNAAFIVRAVNSHQELVEALKLALEFMEQDRCDSYYNPQESEVEIVRAALKKAEGE